MPRRDRINSNVRITGKCGALAQLGERLVCNQEVTGSIPVRSIKQDNDLARHAFPSASPRNPRVTMRRRFECDGVLAWTNLDSPTTPRSRLWSSVGPGPMLAA